MTPALFTSLCEAAFEVHHYSVDDFHDDESESEDWSAPDLDPYEIADAVERVFGEAKIRTSRDSELAFYAMADGKVIGGAYMGHHNDNSCEADVVVVSFDVAVDPAFRRAGVGEALVRRVIADARQMGDHVEMRAWVVNPAMEKVLGRLGFSDGDEARHGNGSCHMSLFL